jgi:hypothetical protein
VLSTPTVTTTHARQANRACGQLRRRDADMKQGNPGLGASDRLRFTNRADILRWAAERRRVLDELIAAERPTQQVLDLKAAA